MYVYMYVCIHIHTHTHTYIYLLARTYGKQRFRGELKKIRIAHRRSKTWRASGLWTTQKQRNKALTMARAQTIHYTSNEQGCWYGVTL